MSLSNSSFSPNIFNILFSIRARELKFWECSPPMCCMSCVKRHMSCVIFKKTNVGASNWRVCYQWGLPRLVLCLNTFEQTQVLVCKPYFPFCPTVYICCFVINCWRNQLQKHYCQTRVQNCQHSHEGRVITTLRSHYILQKKNKCSLLW